MSPLPNLNHPSHPVIQPSCPTSYQGFSFIQDQRGSRLTRPSPHVPLVETLPQKNIITNMQSYREPEPKLAALPPMTRKPQRGEVSIMKGSTISVPQQPQTGRTDHRGPMSAMQPVRRTQPTYNAQVMQPMRLPAPAMPYPVQFVPVQAMVPVGYVIAGRPGSLPVAHPHAHPYPNCFPNQANPQQRPYSSLIPTEAQTPARPPSPPEPQRSMVPMPHELSPKARIHFTSGNKPGILVSKFQDEPFDWLDSPESPIACFEDLVEIPWLFTVSDYSCVGWMLLTL